MHKYDYGLIGNCAYLALISKTGNVGWMCWPRFDSSFIFGGLLDDEKGGHFSVMPESDDFKTHQEYIQNTNVLETTFVDKKGNSYKVIDFAPRFRQMDREYKPLMLIRKIVPIAGNPRIKINCQPVGEYGAKKTNKVFGSSHIRYEGLEQQIRLSTDVSLNYVDSGQPFLLNKEKYLIGLNLFNRTDFSDSILI